MNETWSSAIAAIDRGDVTSLRGLLAAHPELVRDRSDEGEGYFARPYLSWFVAENPIRSGKLPSNIADVARELLAAAAREGTLREQVDHGMALVASGCVPREQNVQAALLDAFFDAGAEPLPALRAAVNGQPEAISTLLALGVDIDAYGGEGMHSHATVLHQAVASGVLASVQRLIAGGADRTIEDRGFGGTALGWAKHFGHAAIVRYLEELPP
jgi:peptide-methionine (S)-S-oxide reductase